ncbi:MAG: FAD-dependent oxidoreductase [Planctomycetes bacterium]|nr:FAD-dependent oxidoreductase [Planctomycetota bacterium]
MSRTELAIIGAGPAGIAAAVTAAELGVQVALLDEYAQPGGQFLRRPPPTLSPRTPPPPDRTRAEGRDLLRRLGLLPIEQRPETQVWGLAGDMALALRGPDGMETLHADRILVATGAYQRLIPFPGWTLPGVFTLGGAQCLVQAQGVRPGHRALVAGTGFLSWIVAAQLLEAGVQVAAVLEATQPRDWLPLAQNPRAVLSRVGQALRARRVLRAAGVPQVFRRAVTRALGRQAVEAVETAEIDGRGVVRPRSTARYEVDCLALGYGFLPGNDLTRLFGCRHAYQFDRGGWSVTVDPRQETSVRAVYAAGEVTGIGGAEKAITEGKIAGLAIAESLNACAPSQSEPRLALAHERLDRLLPLSSSMNRIFQPKPGLWQLALDDTPVCRCEEVTVGDIRAAVRDGCRTCNEVKRCTRGGMGYCQGRICGPIMAELIAQESGQPVEASGILTPRPPLKPIPMAALTASFSTAETRVRSSAADIE